MSAINTQSDWRKDMELSLRISEDMMGGTPAMREASVKHSQHLYAPYIVQFPGESEASFQHRVNLSSFYNFYSRMAKTMMGFLFANGLKIDDSNLPDEFLQNVDRKGRSVEQFARAISMNVLTKGLGFAVVDHANIPQNLGRDEEMALGSGPYWRIISPESTIAGSCKDDGGVDRVTHFRWQETGQVSDGWDHRKTSRIRVADASGAGRDEIIKSAARANIELPDGFIDAPVIHALYESLSADTNNGSGYDLKAAGIVSIGDERREIPIVPFYSEYTSAFRARPPLEDVAYKNIEHWRTATDYASATEMTAFPMHYQVGTDKVIAERGPNITLHSQSPEAEFGIIEPTGTGAEVNEKRLDRILNEAEALGFQLIRRGTDGETRIRSAMEHQKAISPLEDIASNIVDAVNICLRHTARWMGKDEDGAGRARLKVDTGADEGASEIFEAVRGMNVAGLLSSQTTLEEAQRLKILNPELNAEDEARKAREEFGEIAIRDQQTDLFPSGSAE